MENTVNKKDIYEQFAKAQAEFGIAKRNSVGYNYKYADLTELVRVSRPALTKYGLSVTQLLIKGKSGEAAEPMVLVTKLCLNREQWIESTMNVVSGETGQSNNKNLIQVLGSTLGYLERYAYKAITGVVVESAENGSSTQYKR